MKSSKFILAIATLFCVVQLDAMRSLETLTASVSLDPKKPIGDYSRGELMALIMTLPALKQEFTRNVAESRQSVRENYGADRLGYFEDEVTQGRVMGIDYPNNISQKYANETLSSLQRKNNISGKYPF